jgi:hypothetical protein
MPRQPNRQPVALNVALRDTLRVLRQAGPLFIIAAVLIVLPGTMGSNWVRTHPIFEQPGLAATFLQTVLNFVAQLTPGSLYLAAAAWTTARILDGYAANPADFVHAGLKGAAPVLLVQTLSTLAVMAGSFLLIIPGLMLMIAWAFAPQIMAVERVGVLDAFRRSAAITKGRRWMIFGLMIALGAPMVIINCLLFKLSTGFAVTLVEATRQPITLYGVAPVVAAVLAAPMAIGMTAFYRLLNDTSTTRADITAEVFA